MKWKAHFGMEDSRCQEWKGMKDLDNGRQEVVNQSIVITSYNFFHGIQAL